MKIKLTVEVDVAHRSGKFASKEHLAEKLAELVQDALSGESIDTDDDANYEVEDCVAEQA